MLRNSDKEIVARTEDVLNTLLTNRERHIKIVAESREGYVRKATEALQKRLEKFQKGKVADLRFNLSPPVDFTFEYDTIIAMLKLHRDAGEPTIKLSAVDVQRYVLDKWEWGQNFLISNAAYSSTSAVLAAAANLQGVSEDDE